MLTDGKILQADVDMIRVTDDIDEAVNWFVSKDERNP
jgi:hypothetical protein